MNLEDQRMRVRETFKPVLPNKNKFEIANIDFDSIFRPNIESAKIPDFQNIG